MPDFGDSGRERRTFHFEINSFEEFVGFCAVIRGEEINVEKLQEMRRRLKASTDDLEADVKATPPVK